jgi:hypothetical protein
MMAAFGVDEIDLKRGDGDWTNMQPVVRKAFAAIFDVIGKQQEEISSLHTTVAKLRRDVDKKPDQKEINRQISDARSVAHDVLRKGDLSAVHSLLVDIKADVERKASIRYVDNCCERKIDKSEVSMRPLLQNAEHISKLAVDLSQLKLRVDAFDQLPAQISEIKTKAASKDDIKNVLSRVDLLATSVSERLDTNAVLALLSDKADVKEIDGRVEIALKHRHDEMLNETAALERMMLDHERRLSTLEYSTHRAPVNDKKQSETSRQLNKYTRIIEQNIAGVSGSRAADIEHSRRSALIECMQDKINECCDEIHQQAKEQADLKHRVQRLEGNLMKITEDMNGKISHQNDEIIGLKRHVKGTQQSTSDSLDDMENKLSSIYHKVETALHEPLLKRIEAVDVKCDAGQSSLATLHQAHDKHVDLVSSLSSKIQNIENAVVSFNDGVLADVKKEFHRLKGNRAAASQLHDKNYLQIYEKQQEMEIKLHDISGSIKAQLDISGSKFSSVSDMAMSVRTLKQTVKTIIDTTLQQNKKLQSIEASKGSGEDAFRTQLAVDINSRLHACELAVSKLADLEVKSAVSAKSLAILEEDMAETRKITNTFHMQFAEVKCYMPY